MNHFRVSARAQDRIKLPRIFWAGLETIGLTPSAILRKSGLPLTVYGGDSLITSAQNFAIWRAIGELSNDPSIGWKFMSQVETDQYHPTLLAALHARTFGESIERLARYKQLCSAEEFKINPKRDEVAVEVAWPLVADEPVPNLLIDAVFALVLELGRRGTKTRLSPKRVELARRAAPENKFEEYFGCRINYRAGRDVLVLHAKDIERPFVTHNDELLMMLTPQFEQALEDGQSEQSVLDQVKWVLKRLLAGSRPDLSMVAKELGMGERTLQRRITGEGTSFRQLLNDTRRELVHGYLGNPSVEITEAAFLLGYEDPNSFYRAFRSWEGKTPAEWRAENQKTRA
ncbi:MAG: AraC family transcriptional regulator [Verrucomicrobiaceae bacterium]|nr:MAG: AraC family transcriptional regulator [Verrucomicrobiaceae bacterium]